jgi:lysylphosphatidylglycerol synthetase-like protein (DUF2156 family)
LLLMAALGEARPGYELWHPNREKAESRTTKAVVAFVLIVSAALLAIVTLGGWERLQSPGIGALTIVWAGLYVLFALLILNWNRGVLPVASGLAVIMAIFAIVAAPGWFERAKDGLSSPLLPEDLLGLLTVIVIPVQILLVIIAMIAFNQEWQVEEERPIGGGRLDESAGREAAEDFDEPVPAGEDLAHDQQRAPDPEPPDPGAERPA